MIELIATIALLCQVSPAGARLTWMPSALDEYQLLCQQEYLKCIKLFDGHKSLDVALTECVTRRRI